MNKVLFFIKIRFKIKPIVSLYAFLRTPFDERQHLYFVAQDAGLYIVLNKFENYPYPSLALFIPVCTFVALSSKVICE